MTDEDGRQAHVFFLGLCHHWVLLTGVGPGGCLIEVVGKTRFLYIFSYSLIVVGIFRRISWRASASES